MIKNLTVVFALLLGSFTFGAEMAMAEICVTAEGVPVVCSDPTAVKKGSAVPVWEVASCVIGPAGGPYKKIDCQDPKAVHTAPTGNEAVCFLGTDGKIHWDYQREVQIGRPFINRRVAGRWQPDWQTPPPY